MKIKVVSDLHLEFAPVDLTNNEKDVVLIVAGDLAELKNSALVKVFLDQYSWQYKYVVLLCGNHEFYFGKDIKTMFKQYKYLTDEYYNVFLLEKNMVVLDGVRFLGTTLWSDFNSADPVSMYNCKRGLNDFRYISISVGDEIETLRPEHVLAMFKENVSWLNSTLVKQAPTVVVTHHVPSYNLIANEFKIDTLNGAYASNLDDLILDNPQIKLWCFGHSHSSVDKMIGETRMLSNPKGYKDQNQNFDPNMIIEI